MKDEFQDCQSLALSLKKARSSAMLAMAPVMARRLYRKMRL